MTNQLISIDYREEIVDAKVVSTYNYKKPKHKPLVFLNLGPALPGQIAKQPRFKRLDASSYRASAKRKAKVVRNLDKHEIRSISFPKR